MIAELNTHVWWYVARASGIVTWILCGAAIIWGLALSTRALGKNPTPAWLLDLHRWLGVLSVVFVAIHMFGMVSDGWMKPAYSHFGWRELFLLWPRPKNSWFRATAVAWGVVAFYMLVAIQITSWLRSKMPKRVWHTIHLLSFPLFVASTVHGWQNGHDVKNRALLWTAIFVFMMVFGFAFMRVITLRNVESADRSATLAALKAARAANGGAGKTSAATATDSGEPATPRVRAPRADKVDTPVS